MPAIIAAITALIPTITAFFTSIGPALTGIGSMVSAFIGLFNLIHKSSPTVVGKAATAKVFASAIHTAHVTGNTQDLMSAVAALPNTVSE